MSSSKRSSGLSAAVVTLASFVLAGLLIPACATAQEQRGGAGDGRGPTSMPGAGGRAGGRGTAPAVNLGNQMSAMNRSFRAIQAQIKDNTKNESTITLVLQMQMATAASKTVAPPMLRQLPEADRAKQTTEYRNMLTNLLKMEFELESQLVAGDNAKAADTLASIAEIEQQGHKEFRPAAGE